MCDNLFIIKKVEVFLMEKIIILLLIAIITLSGCASEATDHGNQFSKNVHKKSFAYKLNIHKVFMK